MAVKTVDEYINGFEGWKAEIIASVRAIILKTVPDAEESMKIILNLASGSNHVRLHFDLTGPFQGRIFYHRGHNILCLKKK